MASKGIKTAFADNDEAFTVELNADAGNNFTTVKNIQGKLDGRTASIECYALEEAEAVTPNLGPQLTVTVESVANDMLVKDEEIKADVNDDVISKSMTVLGDRLIICTVVKNA